MATYENVQFIGYAIPTIPLTINEIGDPSSACFVQGQYVGIDPQAADIRARIALVLKALRQTVESGAVDPSPSTLKIFVIPEFSFRGTRGAYDDDPPAVDSFTDFRRQFAQRVSGRAYENWLFVVGTIVNTAGRGKSADLDLKARIREDLAVALANLWQYSSKHNDPALASFVMKTLNAYTRYCHNHPVYEVTDKSFVVAGGRPDARYPEGLSIEKKFVSNEDFVLNLHSNAFAEEEVGYPPIDEHYGENKRRAFDPLSIFTIKGIKFGLEVCLDHLAGRLRRSRILPNEHVQIHLVPSCGMQIAQASIVAGAGGLVFNCDGQYGAPMPGSRPGRAHSIWTAAASHKAHTQLTQVVTPCSGKNPSRNNAVLRKPRARVFTAPIRNPTASLLYAYGAGEVHVYTPLRVPPPVARSRTTPTRRH